MVLILPFLPAVNGYDMKVNLQVPQKQKDFEVR